MIRKIFVISEVCNEKMNSLYYLEKRDEYYILTGHMVKQSLFIFTFTIKYGTYKLGGLFKFHAIIVI